MKQLPVIATCKDAIGYTLGNVPVFFKAIIIWMLLYTILVGIFIQMDGEAYVNVFENYLADNINVATNNMQLFDGFFSKLGSFGSLTNWLYIGMFLVSFIAYYSIAIAWHRACLLDEQPPLLKFGLLELKYFGYSILITIILYAFLFIASFTASFIVSTVFGGIAPQLGASISFAAIGAILIIVLLLFVRLFLVFPGIAVQDRRMSLKVSFKATEGNSWRLLGGTILCILPALVIGIIVMLLQNIGLPLIIKLPLAMVLQLVAGAFLLSFMSICYQFFVPSPDEGDLE